MSKIKCSGNPILQIYFKMQTQNNPKHHQIENSISKMISFKHLQQPHLDIYCSFIHLFVLVSLAHLIPPLYSSGISLKN